MIVKQMIISSRCPMRRSDINLQRKRFFFALLGFPKKNVMYNRFLKKRPDNRLDYIRVYRSASTLEIDV